MDKFLQTFFCSLWYWALFLDTFLEHTLQDSKKIVLKCCIFLHRNEKY